ncbi:MAG: GTPase [Candidatus Pacearchaeota archaeon]
MINRRFKANRPKITGSTDITPYWEVVDNIIRESDVIIEVLDARMPELSRNEEIEKKVKESGKELIFAVNKSDLIPEHYLKKRKKFSGKVFYISAKNRNGIEKIRNHIFSLSKKHESIKIGVLGYPNTGKSSLINSLVRSKKAPVSARAGTTHGQQWIAMKKNILIIDSPGVIPLKQNDEIRLSLIGSKNPDKTKNKELVAEKIIELFTDKKNLFEYYKIETKSNNPEEILEEIGRKRGFLKKHGLVDGSRTAEQLIRDWQSGKLRL